MSKCLPAKEKGLQVNNIRIAHFVYDEKFPDSAYEQFEAVCPGVCDYYIASPEIQLKYIKKIPVKFISEQSYKNPLFLKSLEKYNFIVLHALTEFNRKLVYNAKRLNYRLKFIWVGMGYDYYDLIYPDKKDMALQETEAVFLSLKQGEKWQLLQNLKRFVRQVALRIPSKINVIKNIDYFAPVLANEYDMLKKTLFKDIEKNKFPKFIAWNYGTNLEIYENKITQSIDRQQKSIFLGNSATPANNHADALSLLFRDEYKRLFDVIYCPLSYGSIEYGDVIIKLGRDFFGDRFKPLSDFVPIEEYARVIAKCPVVIMNHIRQQGTGNAAIAIWNGATLFLREENPLYATYRDRGIRLFSVQQLENEPELLSYRLTDDEIKRNREIHFKYTGREAVLEKTQKMIEICSN